MKTICIVSQKGGTGKTTMAVTLAGGLAAKGARVLLVDADHQANATLAFGLDRQNGVGSLVFHRLKIAQQPESSRWAMPIDPIDFPRRGKLAVIPSDNHTEFIPLVSGYHTAALRDALAVIFGGDFDICLIDTNPSIGEVMAMVYAASDYALVATDPGAWALAGVVSTIESLGAARVQLLGIMPMRFQVERERAPLAHRRLHQLLKERCKREGWRLFTGCRERIAWQEAALLQRCVYLLPGSASLSARNDAWRMVDEVRYALSD